MPDSSILSVQTAVIGAGIAGASVAAELADHGPVALLEAEAAPGMHTTGRSAAMFALIYGPVMVRALTRASRDFLHHPPAGFADRRLVGPRGVLMLARPDQEAALAALFDAVGPLPSVRLVEARDMREVMPLLRPGYVCRGMHDTDCQDIDVAALHQAWLRQFAHRGGRLLVNSRVCALAPAAGGWLLETKQRRVRCERVVNAAGAWADEVAMLAGARPVGLIPRRRTALTVEAPRDPAAAGWPMTVDIDEQFYLKPEAGRLLLSPGDETACPPGDVQPEEIDVATAIDRVQRAFELPISRLSSRWAGLRSFVADREPVLGEDPCRPGFFWLAGQGGYGIQTAPAMARVAAAAVLGRPWPADVLAQGVTPEALAPGRAPLR
ncbi:MAG: FAD-dependent oxidoreductase [Burkholderiaceae bacterium]